MIQIGHDEAETLLAAHALGALSTDGERTRIEAHLGQCAECRARLDAYLEVAVRLSPEVDPSPELWDRIVGQLNSPVQLDARRRRAKPPALWLGAAAAAIALVVGVGVGRVAAGGSDPSVGELAADARSEDDSSVLTFLGPDGRPLAEAILAIDGDGFLTNGDLPVLESDRGYQLWALRDGQSVSVALLGEDPDVAMFRAPARFDQLLITEEPAIGSPSPTTAPVASATA